jgi:hypothetical protein
MGFFSGTGTIANTPRVVLRLSVPQTLSGFFLRQKVGSRLLLGARLMHFANDLLALSNAPGLLNQGSHLRTATTVSVDALYTVAGPLKWYGEISWSTAEQDIASAAKQTPVSTLIGPLLESKYLKLRANYTLQSASYFPLLGYYVGDRQGPFGELTLRPFAGVELYASASGYRNNVARNPALPNFRNTSESVGASIQLPGRFSLNGQLTLLDLAVRQNADKPWDRSKNQQQTVTVSRAFARHNLRATARDFRQSSLLSPQRQRSGEIEDTFHVRYLVLGAGVKVQRLIASESRSSLVYRGLAQFNVKGFSAFANIEAGNDLQNRTLLATNAISTTVFGASLNLGKRWEIQGEAYRNNLVTEINPQSIFVLQGQGVFVPGTLAALNQWSVYFRISRKFQWGKDEVTADPGQYALARVPLKGLLEGLVVERMLDGDRPAEGVPVSLDHGRTVLSDAEGRYRFGDVPEGSHNIALALEQLPADFDPGPNKERMVVVYPSKTARGDLDVIRLAIIQGKLAGPPNAPLDAVVIRLAPGDRYTTPDRDGNFAFYNLREGDYQVAVDEKTLPEHAALQQPGRVTVTAKPGRVADPVNFRFEVHKPAKPVRTIFEKKP